MSDSRTIEVTIEVEVPFHKEIDSNYGADADGKRGVRVCVYVPDESAVHVLSRVPREVAVWAKQEALSIFEDRYN